MIFDFREGGRFSKIGKSLNKNFFIRGGKSEVGGRGVKNGPKKSDIIYGRPLREQFFEINRFKSSFFN